MQIVAPLILMFATFFYGVADCGCSDSGMNLPVSVRPTDLDVNGHANNARHVEYLQWGRWDWMQRHGFAPASLKEKNIALVVVNINLDYLREINIGDPLIVATRITKVGNKSVVFRQDIFSNRHCNMTALAGGSVTMVCFDLRTRKSCEVPEDLRKVLQAHVH